MKRWLEALASLKLAVILLLLVAAVLAGATIVESTRGTEAAQAVYFSPWFLLLQGIFALNTALALVACFAAIAGASGEGDLLALLEHASPRVREAAVRALGEHGTVASVPSLVPLARRSLAQRGLARAAAEAISRIQGRTGGARGDLSLAASEDGILSLAVEGGTLAVADQGSPREPQREA